MAQGKIAAETGEMRIIFSRMRKDLSEFDQMQQKLDTILGEIGTIWTGVGGTAFQTFMEMTTKPIMRNLRDNMDEMIKKCEITANDIDESEQEIANAWKSSI